MNRFSLMRMLVFYLVSGLLFSGVVAAHSSSVYTDAGSARIKGITKVPNLAAILVSADKEEKMAGLLQATEYYKRLLVDHPEDVESLKQLGKLYSWTGKTDLAITTYQAAISLDNKAAGLKLNLARIYRWSQNFTKAERLYKEVLQSHPEDHDALKGLAKTYLKMGDYRNARIHLVKALKLSPKDAELHKEKALLHAWQKQYPEAIVALKKAIELSPDMFGAHITLGDVYYWYKHYQDALDAYKKALTLDPNSQEAHLMIARIYRILQDYALAKEHIKFALRINPVSSEAMDVLHKIEQDQKKIRYEIGIHFVELFAIIFVVVLISIGYWTNRRLLHHRHRVIANIVRIVLPLILAFYIVVFIAESELKQWLDVETGASISVSLILVLFGLVYLTQMLYTGRGNKLRQDDNVILAIGAHPDDIELGCSGFILKAKANNAKVYGLTLTKGERGTSKINHREYESNRSAFFLELDDFWILDFADTHLQEKTNELKEAIEEIIKKVSPTIVLTHNGHDRHGDHRAVFTATKEAARSLPTILCYESVSTPEDFRPDYYVDITEYLNEMLQVIRLHKSQRKKTYMDPDLLKGRAAHRGIQCGVPYALAFKVYRIMD